MKKSLGYFQAKQTKGKYYKQGYYYVILLRGVLWCCSREFNLMPSLYLALKRDFQAFEESLLKMMWKKVCFFFFFLEKLLMFSKQLWVVLKFSCLFFFSLCCLKKTLCMLLYCSFEKLSCNLKVYMLAVFHFSLFNCRSSIMNQSCWFSWFKNLLASI